MPGKAPEHSMHMSAPGSGWPSLDLGEERR